MAFTAWKWSEKSFFWSIFSRTRTEYGDSQSFRIFIPNTGKYGPEKNPFLILFLQCLLSTVAPYSFSDKPILCWSQSLTFSLQILDHQKCANIEYRLEKGQQVTHSCLTWNFAWILQKGSFRNYLTQKFCVI